MIIADQPDFVGNDFFNLGVIENINFLGSTELYGFNLYGDHDGYGRAPVPIPNSVFLVGAKYYCQATSLWTECHLTPFGLSTSKLLEVTIQQ
jgi:hypothetical protein